MARPGASNGVSIQAPDVRNRQMSKLSSGILGMKFMQQDSEPGASDETANESSAEPTELRKDRTQFGYFAEEDPGQWFAPGVSASAHPAGKKAATATSVGYTDIYGKSSGIGGRRTYGAKPKRIDPEEMVKHYDDESHTKKSDKKKQPSRKRLSSEHADHARSDTRSKRRRS